MKPLPLIIDCDPGIDDAVMLMIAFASPRLDLRAITTVAGNVPLRLTSRNARMICERMGRSDVPVHAGCPRPILRKPVTAEDFHGESGIEGIGIFEPKAPLAPGHAVSELIARLSAAPPLSQTVILSGPMTNLAAALVMAPEIARSIGHLVVMAGGDRIGGNITPYAEFNVFADPHAAAIVFDASIRTTVLSLDVTHTVRAEAPRLASLRKVPGPEARMMADLLEAGNRLEARWKNGQMAPMHDPSTAVYLLAPEIFETRPCRVSVVTRPGAQFGRTKVMDTERGPHHWATAADADAFFGLIESLLKARA
ncbi:MAG: nucleoside hydrolase [Hyphomonas sp.]|uniref:nucleoside hydrolase n=1 Tax=Hyphomonas sp. TaxID=87 RepID=UPI00184A329C|nr:nucleoside hydrolase [Hyphomonas sp.]MBA3067425.1 nucleoside hydrolase [Hyphomonas sp.]MBU3920300.1 nucleoside hydrolase [Alphaproteobacteria bacterium]MBU4061023.1 nucleoside hydrolase [Alphaproteobacteria bacterium]MBU4165879.1 nucleoside hydrolase [Alphaproteobacteria bacterium]